jgi:CRISPR-associated protein Cmr5
MPLTRDQQRASRAYAQVDVLWKAYSEPENANARQSAQKTCEDYEIAVKALGANILRSGLSAALADLMRRKEGAKKLREHLAASQIPGLANATENDVFRKVNDLDVGAYMIATRETLQVVMWLKRACDALFDFKLQDATAAAAGVEGDGHA